MNDNGICRNICKFSLVYQGHGEIDDANLTTNAPTCLVNLINEYRALCANKEFPDNCVAISLREGLDISTLYFGTNCVRVTRPVAMNSCSAGSYTFGQSPVALIWDPSFGVEDLSDDVRLVSFPINPNEPNKLVEWKASSKAPLLVYDPTGEGKIINGYQLFGNWTFGPKKVASLKDTDRSAADGKLWNNGFDALSTLDINSDGEVRGTELEHLSLWFDDNRNAVSEKGEVRRVAAVGVKKLFYQGYASNDAVHAIVLDTGFERERDGKTEQGVLADWFTNTVSSELEYAQKAMIASAFRKNDRVQSSAIASLNKVSSHSPEITKEIIKDESEFLAYKKGAAIVSGFWEWNSESKEIPVSGGRFIILDNEDGTINGLTMIELPLESSFGATSAGLIKPFKGQAKLEADGSVSVTFELKEEGGTTILQSTAKLNKNGTSMDGSSSGKVQSDAAKTDISYIWVATKLK